MRYRILYFVLFLASCTPKLYQPKVAPPDDFVYSQGFERDTAKMATNWWERFGDSTLNRLVYRALENNRDVLTAISRIQEARYNRTVTRAQYLPQVGVSITAESNYNAASGVVQTYSDEPTVTWETPLFGQLHNVNRSAKAAIASSEWAYRGARLSVAAEVATTYFTLLQYQRNLLIARQTVALRQESAALTDSLFRYGMTDGVTLEQTMGLLYTAQADVPQYERAVNQTWLSMGILLGENPQPADLTATGEPLQIDPYPTDIPVGLPSELLQRRPDIMQAQYNMQQAAANAGIARTARFPQLSMTAYVGEASSSLKGLFTGNPFVWEVLGFVTQPVFAFKKLKRSEQVAKEQYNQTALTYEKTILEAFADVEKNLTAISTYRSQTEHYAKLVDSNKQVATLTNALYKNGLSDYLNVIDAERSLYESQTNLVNLTAQQYINYVNLFAALGGGW